AFMLLLCWRHWGPIGFRRIHGPLADRVLSGRSALCAISSGNAVSPAGSIGRSLAGSVHLPRLRRRILRGHFLVLGRSLPRSTAPGPTTVQSWPFLVLGRALAVIAERRIAAACHSTVAVGTSSL
ncbi:hypothetical protein PENTCL1PPCAC_13677, partial [Pristionchus entomophagus]